MKPLRLIVPAMLVLTVIGCAQLSAPQGWQNIGTDGDSKAEYALDLSSRQQTGDVVTFRARVNYPQQVTPPPGIDIPPYTTMVGVWRMDCRQRTYTLVSADFFDRNNQLLKSQTFTNPRPQPVLRNQSALDRQFTLMCRP